MGQGNDFHQADSISVRNGNLRLDYFSEFKVLGLGLKSNDTCGLWGAQAGSFFKPPVIRSGHQVGEQLEPLCCRGLKGSTISQSSL